MYIIEKERQLWQKYIIVGEKVTFKQ